MRTSSPDFLARKFWCCANRLHVAIVLLQPKTDTNQNPKTMKRNRIFDHVNLICITIMTIALLGAGMMDSYIIRLWIAGVALAIVGGLYAVRRIVISQDFAAMTIAQFKKAGLMCKPDDDGFVVTQGGMVMNAKLWNGSSRGLKRVHFAIDFVPNVLNEVKPEGWAVLAAECNASYDHTTVKFYGDHFSCMVETSVRSAKDFLEEYRFAFDKISETLQGMQANADKVTNPFRKKKRNIGFVLPTNQ